MKIFRIFYAIGGLVLIGIGIWIMKDRWVAIFPIGIGVWLFYESEKFRGLLK